MVTSRGRLVLVVLASLASVAQAGQLDPANATWHVGLAELWGKDNKGQSRNLDIYATFVNGRWVRALATARRFNTSIHWVEKADVALQNNALRGKLKVLVTPDRWVPGDGQPIEVVADIDGALREEDGQLRLHGSYEAVVGGQKVKGTLVGGVGPTETGFDDSTWSFALNVVVEPNGTDREMVHISLGKADGGVQWGRVGLLWRRGMPRVFSFETSGLKTTEGRIEGRFTVPSRVINVAGDPKVVCAFDLTAIRIQGLTGGKAAFRIARDGKAWHAYGRGTASRGGGKPDPNAPEPLWLYQVDNDPWFVTPKGFKPPASGEHPRLLFRKSDIPALRKKAQTPEGKAIVARLRALLGNNGAALPTIFNPTPPHNHFKSPKLPLGAFTTWHGAGYGLLYQLTGEKEYADLARQAVQLCFDGKMDRDNRYGWKTPGTVLRAGSILAGVGLAYDLCYDAWPEAFRRKVALSIQNYAQKAHETGGGKTITLELLAGRTGYPPSSNHYGAHVGAATAVLAILGDPGTDTQRLKARLAEFETNLVRALTHGFGDHGYYSEGHHPGRISSNCGLQEFLVALRCAAGRDYITPKPNAQWLTLHWIMEIVPGKDGKPYFPHRGPYGSDSFDGGGMSHSGDIAYGFGTIDEKLKPALLWVYEHFIKPTRPCFGANTYPHRAVAAFVNWPVGIEPVNPAELMPKAVADTIHGYFVNRNRWEDYNDIVVTNLLNIGHEGYHRVKDGGTLIVWGLGLRTRLKTGLRGHVPTCWRPAKDGSSTLSAVQNGRVSSLAIDFSRASGAPLLIAGAGPAFEKVSFRPPRSTEASARLSQFKTGGQSYIIFTLQEGKAAEPKVVGDTIEVGNQTIRFDGRRLHLSHFTP